MALVCLMFLVNAEMATATSADPKFAKALLEDIAYNTDMVALFCALLAVLFASMCMWKLIAGHALPSQYQSLRDELRVTKQELANMKRKFHDLGREKAKPENSHGQVLGKEPGSDSSVNMLFCCPNGEVFHINQLCQSGKVVAPMKGYRPCKICVQKLIAGKGKP